MSRPLARLADWWNRHWFTPAPLRDLAIVRIVLAAGVLVLMPLFSPPSVHLELARVDASLFLPIPALKVLLLPLGWGARPSAELLAVAYVVTLAAGILALVGWYARASMAVFALGNAFFVAHEYSYGEVHHPEGLVAIMLFALAFAPIGEALSVDAVRRRLAAARAHGAFVPAPGDRLDAMALWPLRLGQWLLALAYLSAGVSKLWHGGLEWMNGTTLTYYVVYDALAFDRPLGLWIAQFGWLLQVLSVVTIVWELFFWVAVVVPRTAWLFVLTGTALHVGIYLTQRAPFFHFIVLYIVFLGPIRDEWRRLRAHLARRRAARAAAGAGDGSPAVAARWSVLYDGLCPLCVRTVTVLDVLDGGRRLALVDFEGSWAAASALAPGLTREQAREAMHLVAPDGARTRGFRAFRALTRVVPALWPLAPLVHLPGVAPAGDLVYHFIAARRPRRLCRADSCTI